MIFVHKICFPKHRICQRDTLYVQCVHLHLVFEEHACLIPMSITPPVHMVLSSVIDGTATTVVE